MKQYFDFNLKYADQFSKHVLSETEKNESVFAWNNQVRLMNDKNISAEEYRDIDNIKDIIPKYSKHLICVPGEEYKLAKHIYNAMKYSIVYGAEGEDISKSFFATVTSAHDSVKKGIKTAYPFLPDELIAEVTSNYASKKSTSRNMYQHSETLKEVEGREKQLEYISLVIDPLTTKTQRFKSVLSDVKAFYTDINTPLIVNVITLPVAVPLIALGGAVKVFAGESGELRLQDNVEKIITGLNEIKESVTFKNVKNNLSKLREQFLNGSKSKHSNKL